MNTAMLENPITQDNLATLKNTVPASSTDRGNAGARTSEKETAGPEVLLDYIAMELAREKTPRLRVRVTVTAGPAAGILDLVRYPTVNHSSGRMGYASSAGGDAPRGAGDADFRPGSIKPGSRRCDATGDDGEGHAGGGAETLPETDILIKAAAVADYRVRMTVADQKIKRTVTR